MDKLPAALDLRKAVGRTIEERLRVEDRRGITVDPGYGRAKRRIHVERELRETLQAAKGELLSEARHFEREADGPCFPALRLSEQPKLAQPILPHVLPLCRHR